VEILGYPAVDLDVAATAPVAFLSVKLCDVFPDGTSALVSRGFLNLTHRYSWSDPEPLEPGRVYRIHVDLDATSWTFESGHRIRLDVAGTDWPNAWAPPAPVTMAVERARSTLSLPVLEGGADVATRPRLAPPTTTRDPDDPATVWRWEEDVLARRARHIIDHGVAYDLDVGGRAVDHYWGRNEVSVDDPGLCEIEGTASFRLEWPDVNVGAATRTLLSSDADDYRLVIDLDVTEDGKSVWSRRWERSIPRRLQ
jgi:hypothetical protein